MVARYFSQCRTAAPLAVALICLPATATASPRGFESDVLGELNAMRADPDRYVGELRAYRGRIEGLIVYGAEGESDYQTREGVRPVDEAIALLRRTAPLGELRFSDVLARAAADHVAAQSRSGGVGHISNGRDPSARVVARGGGRYVGEVITYGHSDPASVVRQLIVDDGVPGRGHRGQLLAARYRYAGVACGPHRVWRTMCVIDLSETPDGSPPPPPKRSR